MTLRYFLKSSAVILLSILLSGVAFGTVGFNGDADYIGGVDIDAIDTATDLTISVWVYHSTQTTDDGIFDKRGTNGIYLQRDDAASGSGRTDCYRIQLDDSADTDSAVLDTATNSATTGIWRHLLITVDLGSATGLHFYINGIEDANSPVSLSTIGAIDSGAKVYSFGMAIDAGRVFAGTITELAIWTSILTSQEISLLVNSKIKGMPKQIQPVSLVLYLPLDENSIATGINGVQFDDYSGSGNNGTGVDADGDSLIIGESVLSYPPSPMVQ